MPEKDGRCGTCNWFGQPASENGTKFQAGGCGNPKLQYLSWLSDAQVELGDRLVYNNMLHVGFNFGCIHYK